MPTDQTGPRSAADKPAEAQGAGARPLAPAAERALAEAAARRRAERERAKLDRPQEVAGRGDLDPTRYGDWEINGLASDF